MLAEEGDDLSSISVPSDLGPEGAGSSSATPEKSETKAEPSPPKEKKAAPPKDEPKAKVAGHKQIKHSKPMFPSVLRL